MSTQIHWFPGHMNKALKEMEEKIKIVDVVIELLDMRIPLSSVNDNFENVIKNKNRLFVFTKTDLADDEQTKLWKKKFDEENKDYLVLDLLHTDVSKILSNKIASLAKGKHEKEKAKGMKPQPIRAMIIGIPNVGKSSLINKVARRKAAGVENRPGFTRGEQFIKINNDFLLVDTPGVLPMNYEDKRKAINLALVGSIKEDILPTIDLAGHLVEFLKKRYPTSLKDRFDIEEITEINQVLQQISCRRGLISSNGQADIEKAAMVLLKEFKDGKLGKISLEWSK